MSGKYDDIINLEHPEPRSHPRMSQHDRAAQFSPFAALSGFEEAIDMSGEYFKKHAETVKGEIIDIP